MQLQVLPSGLSVPDPAYLAVLLAVALVLAGALLMYRPAVTQRLVVAFTPWMVVGAALHALYQLSAVPPLLSPLFGAPTVYLTTFLAAGLVWATLLALDADAVSLGLAGVGSALALGASAYVLLAGASRGTLSPWLPALGVVVSVAVAGGALAVLNRLRPSVVERTGSLGAVVVVGHALDGISTAIGVDLLGAGERSPIPRLIMDVAGTLPTPFGRGWLFVLVKLAIAVGVLALFADFVEEEPAQGNATLGLVAAVGLGPGAHNILLFAAGA